MNESPSQHAQFSFLDIHSILVWNVMIYQVLPSHVSRPVWNVLIFHLNVKSLSNLSLGSCYDFTCIYVKSFSVVQSNVFSWFYIFMSSSSWCQVWNSVIILHFLSYHVLLSSPVWNSVMILHFLSWQVPLGSPVWNVVLILHFPTFPLYLM